jgi:hypothetical protein
VHQLGFGGLGIGLAIKRIGRADFGDQQADLTDGHSAS